MRKVAYYLLGLFLAIVPFIVMMTVLITLAYTPMDNYTLASIGVVLYSLYFAYLVWMFAD